jgi:hypothetical protein
MPTILTLQGYQIAIFVHDHEPPHVHVFARGCEAIFLLNCPLGPPSLRKNWRFKAKELRVIDGLLLTYNELFCMAWGQIHAHSKRH